MRYLNASLQALSECRALGLFGCVFGSASFVLLYPDSSIAPTIGDTNARLHCDTGKRLCGVCVTGV